MGDKIGIVEFRNIVAAIQESYEIDLRDFALTSLKRRIEKVLKVFNYKSADQLISKIQNDPSFVESFLHTISVSETEMFRDPSFWNEFKDKVIPKLLSVKNNNIWIPCATTGEEFYTLQMILHELGIQDKFKVTISGISQENLDFIKKGEYDLKKSELNEANYKRYSVNRDFKDYAKLTGRKVIMDSGLRKNASFVKHNIFKDSAPTDACLILYRNKILYFNQTLQNKVLRILDRAICGGGFLIIGVKESFDTSVTTGKYSRYSKNEKIFKKAG
jgi:chemotaxis protein methyltransferase CheR